MITFSDMLTHLAVQLGGPVQGYLEGRVRTAVLNGWARLFAMRKWAYFHRIGYLQVYAAQTDGTVAFDLSTRQVTLTDSTWPADVVVQHIKLETTWYPIYRRISDTVIELWPDQHPPEDLAAETTYALQQVMYPLPHNVSDVVQVLQGGQVRRITRLSLLEAHQVWQGFTWSLPEVYALIGDARYPNQWCMWVPTQLSADDVLPYLYQVRKPPEVLTKETRGEVTVASGVATFTESVVNNLWLGAVLRVGTDNTNQPTGEFGDIDGTELRFNRSGTETIVTEIVSSTSCRISNTTLAATSVCYVASAHIDVADGPMSILLQRLVEQEYGTRPVGNHTESMVSQSRLANAFMDAAAADSRFVREEPLAGWYDLGLADIGRVVPS